MADQNQKKTCYVVGDLHLDKNKTIHPNFGVFSETNPTTYQPSIQWVQYESTKDDYGAAHADCVLQMEHDARFHRVSEEGASRPVWVPATPQQFKEKMERLRKKAEEEYRLREEAEKNK